MHPAVFANKRASLWAHINLEEAGAWPLTPDLLFFTRVLTAVDFLSWWCCARPKMDSRWFTLGTPVPKWPMSRLIFLYWECKSFDKTIPILSKFTYHTALLKSKCFCDSCPLDLKHNSTRAFHPNRCLSAIILYRGGYESLRVCIGAANERGFVEKWKSESHHRRWWWR